MAAFENRLEGLETSSLFLNRLVRAHISRANGLDQPGIPVGGELVEQFTCVSRKPVDCQAHPHAELRVVLEERGGPGWAAPVEARGMGRGRQVGPVDRRATRRI